MKNKFYILLVFIFFIFGCRLYKQRTYCHGFYVFRYIDKDSVEICGFDSSVSITHFGKTLYIPETIYGHKVVKISGIADSNPSYMDNVKKIILPKTIKIIGEKAFTFHNLEDISLHEGITEIGAYAFSRTSLKKITLPSTLKSIGEGAFENCESLAGVSLPKGLTEIGACAFLRTSLEYITLPDTLKRIGAGVFWDCSELKGISLPEGLTYIPYAMFGRCKSLKSITLPASLGWIGREAFKFCESLENVIFKDTSDWYISTDENVWKPIDVTDPSTNASNLRYEFMYSDYIWAKASE